MKPPFSSDPEAMFAAWQEALELQVPMADGTTDQSEFGLWRTQANKGFGGKISSMRRVFDELARSQNPARQRAEVARRRQMAPPAAAQPRRTPLVTEDQCWVYQTGLAGMDLVIMENGRLRVRAWVMEEAAKRFPFKVTPATAGNLAGDVEGLDTRPGAIAGAGTAELVQKLAALSPSSPLIALPKLPRRQFGMQADRPAVQRVLALELEGPDGQVQTVFRVLSHRLLLEAAKDTPGALDLLMRERDRSAKQYGRTIKNGGYSPQTIARTISLICGVAGAGEPFGELGITAHVYPRHLLYGWLLDLAWSRGGRPDDPEAFKSFIRNWVLGELATVPKEYRPAPKVADPPTAA